MILGKEIGKLTQDRLIKKDETLQQTDGIGEPSFKEGNGYVLMMARE